MNTSDFIFENNNGTTSGGFSVQSIMMKKGLSPIMTLNTNHPQVGGMNQVSDIFKNLVVPSWAWNFSNDTLKGGNYDRNNDFDDNEDTQNEDDNKDNKEDEYNKDTRNNEDNKEDDNDEDTQNNEDENTDENVIDDDIHEQLVQLVKHKLNRKTKREKYIKGGTKKNNKIRLIPSKNTKRFKRNTKEKTRRHKKLII